MSIKYVHTNIISENFQELARFYIECLGCTASGKEFELYGEYLEKGTAIKSAKLKGINLNLPGYPETGPKLEIFQYQEMLERPDQVVSNRKGYGHLAFHVDDIEEVVGKILENGGEKVGEIAVKEFKHGTLSYIYVTDPEGNIIELQNYKPRPN